MACKADRCGKNVLAKGLCRNHYTRSRRRSDGSYEDRRRYLYGATPLERYEHTIDRSGGPDACHPWLGTKCKGYGTFWDGTYTASGNSRKVKAHAYGFRSLIRSLEPGEVVRHRCLNKACQNPRHWIAGTQGQNAQDSIDALGRHADRRKLDFETAQKIRAEYPGTTQAALAIKYGVAQAQISRVLRGKQWRPEQHIRDTTDVLPEAITPRGAVRRGEVAA